MIHTLEQIEQGFTEVLARIKARKEQRKVLTDHEKLIIRMAREKTKVWWLPYELMGDGNIDGADLFIGYEVTARLSELGGNKELIESRSAGKYEARRLRLETETTQNYLASLRARLYGQNGKM